MTAVGLESSPPLGVAIIGWGAIGRFHARAFAEVPGTRLAAVCHVSGEPSAEVSVVDGVPHYRSVDSMLARPDIDVVSICTPSGLHAKIGVEIARSGRHVVVEKPIDVTLAAADALIEACDTAGVKLTVISQRRYEPGFARLREIVDSGRLGRLFLGDVNLKWYRSQDYYDSAQWRGTRALDGGGCLMNQGTHYVDLLQWIMGPARSVYGCCRTEAHERVEIEDIALAVVKFESGAVGVIEASTAVYPGLPARLEVSGTNGSVVIEDGKLKLRAFMGEEPQLEEPATTSTAASNPMGISTAAHVAQLTDFLTAVRTGGRAPVDGREGRRTVEIVLAVYESARLGREVTLPLRAEPTT